MKTRLPLGHNPQRRLLIGAVGLVKGKVPGARAAVEAVRDEFEPVLESSGWFPAAPFACVSLILRWGNKADLRPEFQSIVTKYDELPVSLQLSMDEGRRASRDPENLRRTVRSATLRALLAVGERYGLPGEALVGLGDANKG